MLYYRTLYKTIGTLELKLSLISILFLLFWNDASADHFDGNYILKLNDSQVNIVGFKGWVLNTHLYPSDKQINFNAPAIAGEGTSAYPDLTISEQETGGSVRLHQFVELLHSVALPKNFVLKPGTFDYKSRKYLEFATQGSTSESQLIVISHSLLFEENGKIFECLLRTTREKYTKENKNELLRLCSSSSFSEFKK